MTKSIYSQILIMYVEKSKTYNVIALSEVKDHLQIYQDDNDFNNQLNRLIKTAVQYCENFCEIDIVPTKTVFEDYHIAGGYIDISQSPISNIGISGYTDIERIPVLTIVTGYTIQKHSQFTRLKFKDYKQFDKIVISYESGFATIPSDLKHACLMLIAQFLDVDKNGYTNTNLAESKAINRLLFHYKNYY